MVKMTPIDGLCLALLLGLTTGGLAGSILEIVARKSVRFAEPFVSRFHLGRSILTTGLVGPFMLANDALEARRVGSASGLLLAGCLAASLCWAGSLGIVMLNVASLGLTLLS